MKWQKPFSKILHVEKKEENQDKVKDEYYNAMKIEELKEKSTEYFTCFEGC